MSLMLNIVLLIATLGLTIVMGLAFYIGWKLGPPKFPSFPPPMSPEEYAAKYKNIYHIPERGFRSRRHCTTLLSDES